MTNENKTTKAHFVLWDDNKIRQFWSIYQTSTNVEWSPIWSRQYADYLYYGVKNYLEGEDNVVDVGCGSGDFLKYLHSKGFKKLTGVDISTANLDKITFAKTINSCVSEIPVDNDTYDVVFFIAVVEHLLDANKSNILKELYRILRHGGLLIINTPYDEQLEYSYCLCPDCLAIFHKDQHLRSFNEKSIQGFFNETDFLLESIKTFSPIRSKWLLMNRLRMWAGYSKWYKKLLRLKPSEMVVVFRKPEKR